MLKSPSNGKVSIAANRRQWFRKKAPIELQPMFGFLQWPAPILACFCLSPESLENRPDWLYEEPVKAQMLYGT